MQKVAYNRIFGKVYGSFDGIYGCFDESVDFIGCESILSSYKKGLS